MKNSTKLFVALAAGTALAAGPLLNRIETRAVTQAVHERQTQAEQQYGIDLEPITSVRLRQRSESTPEDICNNTVYGYGSIDAPRPRTSFRPKPALRWLVGDMPESYELIADHAIAHQVLIDAFNDRANGEYDRFENAPNIGSYKLEERGVPPIEAYDLANDHVAFVDESWARYSTPGCDTDPEMRRFFDAHGLEGALAILDDPVPANQTLATYLANESDKLR